MELLSTILTHLKIIKIMKAKIGKVILDIYTISFKNVPSVFCWITKLRSIHCLLAIILEKLS